MHAAFVDGRRAAGERLGALREDADRRKRARRGGSSNRTRHTTGAASSRSGITAQSRRPPKRCNGGGFELGRQTEHTTYVPEAFGPSEHIWRRRRRHGNSGNVQVTINAQAADAPRDA
jgi:hypothetical protein